MQRMETYRGLAIILTTNLKNSMDQVFLRRLRFVVQFPYPDAKQRADIWRQVFPANTPTEGLIPERLAKLSITGGNIRNIALNAAFIAADANEPVMMKHLLLAAKREYLKLERPLTDTEIKGWA
jgi:SpoVK/Ycf46/Vps4 family AAA+-type ATPase